MEEFREAATLYYNNSTQEIQNLAKSFFNSMDTDKDGRISQAEFLNFLEETGNKKILPGLFDELDRNGDGSLGFWEVVTMYYMATNCILCDGCRNWLHGMYFTCLPCFEGSESSFNLCLACYRERKFSHCHSDNQFLDNYSFHNYIREWRRASTGPNSTHSAKDPKMERRASIILEGINVGCAIGSTGVAIGTAAAAVGLCNIM